MVSPFKSLSFRLLLLTAFFVMLAEVLIYSPSIARFRLVYFEERLAAAHLASLAIQANEDIAVSRMLEEELLSHVGAYSVVAIQDGAPMLLLARASQPAADATYDIRDHKAMPLIWDAFVALAQRENRVLKVIGPSPKNSEMLLSITIDEHPLRLAMYDYSWRILVLSIVISLITAALVFLSLRWLMVRPMQRITEGLVRFRQSPEDSSDEQLEERGRADEIGIAQRELDSMKQGLRAALRQQARLALLGTAVNKINHDLRNMLSTANLISDRLAESSDPTVRRVAPPLIRAIDRAVELCSQSLNFTQDTPPLRIGSVLVAELVNDIQSLMAETIDAPFEISLCDDSDVEVRGDRTQIYRVLTNLTGNAVAAGARRVELSLIEAPEDKIRIAITDNGPGISASARDTLFKPFQHHSDGGGYGLGLAIAHDIAKAHGGDLYLQSTGPEGTTFVLELPR